MSHITILSVTTYWSTSKTVRMLLCQPVWLALDNIAMEASMVVSMTLRSSCLNHSKSALMTLRSQLATLVHVICTTTIRMSSWYPIAVQPISSHLRWSNLNWTSEQTPTSMTEGSALVQADCLMSGAWDAFSTSSSLANNCSTAMSMYSSSYGLQRPSSTYSRKVDLRRSTTTSIWLTSWSISWCEIHDFDQRLTTSWSDSSMSMPCLSPLILAIHDSIDCSLLSQRSSRNVVAKYHLIRCSSRLPILWSPKLIETTKMEVIGIKRR